MKGLSGTAAFLEEMLQQKRLSAYAVAVGYEDSEWLLTSPGVDEDSYFDAASVGKVFPTCSLAFKAIDAGKLSLDDTLEQFFPNVPADKKAITVHQLMTHTSGLYRREFPEDVAARGRESITEFILDTPLKTAPGTGFAYCCTGMVLLGFIVEKIWGIGLDEAFEQLMCRPLGLTRSRYNIRPDEPNAVNCHHDPAVTDIRWDDHNVQMMNGIPAGAGGLFITVGDLRRFCKALLKKDERLYSGEMFDLAERNYTADLIPIEPGRGIENHGLGYFYVNDNCTQACELFSEGSIGHTGWTGQSFFVDRSKKLYVAALTDVTRCRFLYREESRRDMDAAAFRTLLHRAIKTDLGL